MCWSLPAKKIKSWRKKIVSVLSQNGKKLETNGHIAYIYIYILYWLTFLCACCLGMAAGGADVDGEQGNAEKSIRGHHDDCVVHTRTLVHSH